MFPVKLIVVVIMQKKQIEIPVHDNPIVTFRSLDKDHPSNSNQYEINQKLNDLIREVKIRFDTNPDYYQKEDFKKLIQLISGSVKYLQDSNFDEELIILNQKIELLKQKLLEFGTISKEQIDSLFKDLEVEIPYPTKTKKYTEEVLFDFAYWQKPGAKPGTKVLITNAQIPDEKNNGYGAVWGKFFVNKPENFLVTVGTLCRVGNTDEYVGYIENITGTLRILQLFKTTDTIGEPVFKTCCWNDSVKETDGLYVDNYTGTIKIKGKQATRPGKPISKKSKYIDSLTPPKKLNVCISVADYFGIEILPDFKIYSLESEPNSYKWNLVPVNQSEYKCKYHKLKVQNNEGILQRNTWRIYNRANIHSENKKIYLCKKRRFKHARLNRASHMGWVKMLDSHNYLRNIEHKIGIRSGGSRHAYIMYYEGNKYQTSNGIIYRYKYTDDILNASTYLYIKDIQPLKIAY